MKVSVYGLDGKEAGKIELPKVFSEPLRKDLILRAFLSTMSRRRQPFGTSEVAGMRSSAHYYGARRTGRWIMMGREMARMPRVHGKIPGYLMYRARKVPQSTKGRLAHPPKVEKVWPQKINRKERKKAIMSAIAATADRKLVEQRGHRVGGVKELPIVVDDAVEKMKKTAEVKKLFESLGLKEEMERIEQRSVRAGKAKVRGRKYKTKTGPLLVVAKDEGIVNAAKGMGGVDVVGVNELGVGALCPGAAAGRLAIFTKGAIEKLGK